MKFNLVSLVYATNPLTEHLDVDGLKLTPIHIVSTQAAPNTTVYVRFEMQTLMRHWLKAYPAFKKDTTTRRELRRVLALQLQEQDKLIAKHEDDSNMLIISEVDFKDARNLTVKQLHKTIATYLSHM